MSQDRGVYPWTFAHPGTVLSSAYMFKIPCSLGKKKEGQEVQAWKIPWFIGQPEDQVSGATLSYVAAVPPRSKMNLCNLFICEHFLTMHAAAGSLICHCVLFWRFFDHPPSCIRVFSSHKVRGNCHFLDHPPTPMPLSNIKMVPN